MYMKTLSTETKDKIVRLITALLPDVKIYLFGSRARGTNDEWSDIDLALDAGKKLPLTAVDEVGSVLAETNLPYKIDVVDFYRMSELMQEKVKTEGILWKM